MTVREALIYWFGKAKDYFARKYHTHVVNDITDLSIKSNNDIDDLLN